MLVVEIRQQNVANGVCEYQSKKGTKAYACSLSKKIGLDRVLLDIEIHCHFDVFFDETDRGCDRWLLAHRV